MKDRYYYDVIIIGSGAAGLTLALSLAKYSKVAVISKGTIDEGSTSYAQGGIAAVMGENDSVESHIADTIKVGDGLCDKDVVRFVATNARDSINWLIEQGVDFTKEESGKFHLTREGGHSYRRVLHFADSTGQVVENGLVEKIKKSSVDTFTEYTAINLIKQNEVCTGVYALNNRQNVVKTFQAKFIVLATGGASKAYLYTTNPNCSSGDGIAMAHRIGCQISNMEFNQFHPTCLYHHQEKSFLISEAVRGEGGRLVLPDGTRFMSKFDGRAELASRDIVARAIDFEMKRLGIDCVYLDITHKSPQFVTEHFPNIYKRCIELGIDITKSYIPVVPAAHYTCGGVVVDINGRTSVDNLYAIGETSCTGLHGANRIASNSLLECIVYGRAASEDIKKRLANTKIPLPCELWNEDQVTGSDEEVVVAHSWNEIRHLMWDYVGIVRTNKRLERAQRRIELLKPEIHEYYSRFKVSKNLIELRNLVVIAELIISAAKKRKNNVGLHYNLDIAR